MSYLEDPEDKAYICPHCGGDEPIIESSEILGRFWRGGIQCGACLASYKPAMELIPIQRYRVLQDWVDNREARKAEAQERTAAELYLGVEIDAMFEARYNEKMEAFYQYLEKTDRL